MWTVFLRLKFTNHLTLDNFSFLWLSFSFLLNKLRSAKKRYHLMSTYSLDSFYIIWLNVLFIWILGVSIFFTLNSEMNCLVLPSYVGIRDGIWIWSENRFFRTLSYHHIILPLLLCLLCPSLKAIVSSNEDNTYGIHWKL